MPLYGFGPEPRFAQRTPRSLYADESPEEDRVSALFNEAWYEVARRSWRQAEGTLGELLELAPDDGEALVLLAKVHVAQGRLQAGLDALDAARESGWPVDPTLRQALLDRVRHSHPPGDMDVDTPSAPVPGVMDAVAARQQSFRLRQDNQDLQQKIESLEREVRRWIFATMGVCITATALVTWALMPPMPPRTADHDLASVMIPVPPMIRRGAAHSPLDDVADAAIPNVSSTLSAKLEHRVAIANGELADFQERQAIERAWLSLDDVDAVDWSGVVVTSRSVGGRVLVRPGDTLSGIAYRYYGDSSAIGPIERANGIDAKSLVPGQYLAIPGGALD